MECHVVVRYLHLPSDIVQGYQGPTRESRRTARHDLPRWYVGNARRFSNSLSPLSALGTVYYAYVGLTRAQSHHALTIGQYFGRGQHDQYHQLPCEWKQAEIRIQGLY